MSVVSTTSDMNHPTPDSDPLDSAAIVGLESRKDESKEAANIDFESPADHSLNARWIDDPNELEKFIEPWKHLADNSVHRNGAFDHNFLLPAFRHLVSRDKTIRNKETSDRVRVLVIEAHAKKNAKGSTERESAKLAGLAPFAETKIFRLPWSAVQIWKHDQFFDTTPLLHKDYADRAWHLMLQQLASENYSFLELDTVSADPAFSELLGRTENQIPVFGRFLKQKYQRAALRPSTTGEEYQMHAVSSSKRKKIRRLLRRLESLGQITFERCSTDADFDVLADDFLRIEKSGWKGENGTALASDLQTEAFYRELIERLAARGQARFVRLLCDGKPIAMLSDFQAGSNVYSYKTAYDPEFAAYSPGMQIEYKNIEFLHQDRIHFADSCTSAENVMMSGLWSEKTSFQHLVLALRGGIPRLMTKLFPLGQKLSRIFRRNSN